MSQISGTSTITSILKKSSTIKSRLNASTNKVRFELCHSPRLAKVQSILQEYVLQNNRKDYENLLCFIRDAELLDSDVYYLLQEATECLSMLNLDLRLFVEALLTISWSDREEKLVTEYQSFLVNLLSAHNYHAKIVITHLVSLFLPKPEEEEWPEGVPSDSDCKKCVNVHSVLNVLLKIIPLCSELLLNCLINQFPYFKKDTHTLEYYIHNLLWITNYQPGFRKDILHLIISKLIMMDVNLPRCEIEKAMFEQNNEVFSIDDYEGMNKTDDNVLSRLHTLDVCLNRILNFIIAECYDHGTGDLIWDQTKDLYYDLLDIFEKLVLLTYGSHHVQFCMFLLCSFKSTLIEGFLQFLWKKVCNPNIPPILRQSAVFHISSIVARANYVSSEMLKNILHEMANWIHTYIGSQDGLDSVNSDIRVHGVFYSVCQSLFYVTVFRHKELIGRKKDIIFLQSLNLAKIVTCRLNPLRVCQTAVVQNFAAFTRKYQLVYCYAIIEHNARNVMPTIYQDEKGSVTISNNILDDFYPFDPCMLERTNEKIQLIYRDYEETNEEFYSEPKETPEDDFLDQVQDFSKTSPSNTLFSYGTSPGFKFKT